MSEIPRDELVRLTLEAIAKQDAQPDGEDPIRDRLLAEIYATCYQLENVLEMMLQQGPTGIMKMMFGGKKRRKELEEHGRTREGNEERNEDEEDRTAAIG